ncbi:MAG: hypothetical protein IBJ18_09205 [Phycisphaerales bacterium]|nr:hypothetical protein [Phycisphaerales bacterium]
MNVALLLPIVQAAVVPSAVGLLVLTPLWWRHGKSTHAMDWSKHQGDDPRRFKVFTGVAFAIGSLAALAWSFYKPGTGWEIIAAENWLPVFALAGVFLSLIGGLFPVLTYWRGAVISTLARLVVISAVVWCSLTGSRSFAMPEPERWGMIGMMVGSGLVWWWALESIARQTRWIEGPLALIFAFTSVSFTLLLTGNAVLGQSAGPLAAVAGAAMIVAAIRPGLSLAGVGGVGAMLVTGLVDQGTRYGITTPGQAAVLLLVPTGLLLSSFLAAKDPTVRAGMPGLQGVLLRSALIFGICALTVLAVVMLNPPAEANPYQGWGN